MQGGYQYGGGARTEASSVKLGDIGDYKDIGDLYPILSATALGLNFAVAMAKSGAGGISVNTYFNNFGLEGLLSNAALVTILFQVARWAYSTLYAAGPAGKKPWSPIVFLAILVGVQLIHDVLFYYGAIRALPTGANEMIDTLKGYAVENGGRALGAHSTFLLFIGLAAMLLKETSIAMSMLITVVALYMLPYMITTFGADAKKVVAAVAAKPAAAPEAKPAPMVVPPIMPAVPAPSAFSGDAWAPLR